MSGLIGDRSASNRTLASPSECVSVSINGSDDQSEKTGRRQRYSNQKN
jgi:hypothetical protein